VFARSGFFGWVGSALGSAVSGGRLILKGLVKAMVRYAGIVQAVAALAAVGVAYYTIDRAATQLMGTTIYNVAKDGKALQRRFESGDATPDEVMSYFFSVYTLRENGILNDRTWRPVEIALCNFIKSGPNVQQAWQKYRANYDPVFQDLVDGLRGRKCE
jgi:hypothetical protein